MNLEEIRELMFPLTSDGSVRLRLYDDLPIFHRLISALEPGQVYLEVGTAQGYTALCAALSAQDGVEIWTLDNAWQTGEAQYLVRYIGKTMWRFCHMGVMHKIRFCPLASFALPWDGKPIDVLFLDGDKREVRADFAKWGQYVPVGGVALFHDIKVWGQEVPVEVARLAETSDWIEEEGHWNMAVLRRA